MSEKVLERVETDKSIGENGEREENLTENKEENSAGAKSSDTSNSENTAESGQEVKSKPKSRLPLYIGGAVLLVAAIVGLIYWLYARQYESTDDAFIESDVVQISPKVSAYVAKVHVKENQQIHKGDLLVELDTKDYEAKLEQAKAQLRTAQAQRTQSQASVDLTRKTVQASQSQAQSNVQTARSNVEQTRLAADSKQSQIRQAQSVHPASD